MLGTRRVGASPFQSCHLCNCERDTTAAIPASPCVFSRPVSAWLKSKPMVASAALFDKMSGPALWSNSQPLMEAMRARIINDLVSFCDCLRPRLKSSCFLSTSVEIRQSKTASRPTIRRSRICIFYTASVTSGNRREPGCRLTKVVGSRSTSARNFRLRTPSSNPSVLRFPLRQRLNGPRLSAVSL